MNLLASLAVTPVNVLLMVLLCVISVAITVMHKSNKQLREANSRFANVRDDDPHMVEI